MVISIDKGKTCDKILYAFMIKVSENIGREGTYFNIKSIYGNPTVNIILSAEELEAIP